MQLLLKNAHYYINGAFLIGDISADEGKIIAIDAAGSKSEADCIQVIDADGLWVLPGLVDSHTHFRDPGPNLAEDFFTGSLAAAAGGFTVVCDMPNVCPTPSNAEALTKRIAAAEKKSLIDIAFYGAAGFSNRYKLQELLDTGVVALKTFLQEAPLGREEEFSGLTAADDGQLFLLMQEVAKTDGRLMFHCENYQLIRRLEEQLKAAGITDNSFHYKSRPDVAEIQSVATVIAFAEATGAKVGICHVSVPQSCQLVREAQNAGLDIIAETCYHYLIFDNSFIDKFGSYAKCNPPLRSREDVEGLWDYVMDGTISMIGSDHAPFLPEKKTLAPNDPIWKAPSGIAGIEVMVTLLLQKVNEGKISLADLALLTSENSCKNMGLYPQKGCIAIGCDADFTIVDMEQKYIVDKSKMQTGAKDNNILFDGLELQGRPVYTILRGEVLMDHGIVDRSYQGFGHYLKRCT